MPNYTSKFQAIVEKLILGPRPFLEVFPQRCHQNFMLSVIILIITVDPIEELS